MACDGRGSTTHLINDLYDKGPRRAAEKRWGNNGDGSIDIGHSGGGGEGDTEQWTNVIFITERKRILLIKEERLTV